MGRGQARQGRSCSLARSPGLHSGFLYLRSTGKKGREQRRGGRAQTAWTGDRPGRDVRTDLFCLFCVVAGDPRSMGRRGRRTRRAWKASVGGSALRLCGRWSERIYKSLK